MEEIRNAGKAYYANLSDEAKKQMVDSFRSVDKDGDGQISFQEFMAHLGDDDIKTLLNRMFRLVDENGDGTLQFDEFITLLYMCESPRPMCDGCGNYLIGGLFFTCTDCWLGNGGATDTYDICIPCYHGKLFLHEHADFVDNYFVLSKMREIISSSASYNQATAQQSDRGYPSSTSAIKEKKSGKQKAADNFLKVLKVGEVIAQFMLG